MSCICFDFFFPVEQTWGFQLTSLTLRINPFDKLTSFHCQNNLGGFPSPPLKTVAEPSSSPGQKSSSQPGFTHDKFKPVHFEASFILQPELWFSQAARYCIALHVEITRSQPLLCLILCKYLFNWAISFHSVLACNTTSGASCKILGKLSTNEALTNEASLAALWWADTLRENVWKYSFCLRKIYKWGSNGFSPWGGDFI